MELAISDRAVVAPARHTSRSRILLSAAQPVRKRVVSRDMVKRGRRLIEPRAPSEPVVHRDHRALVRHQQLDVRIVRVNPIALVIVTARRAAMRGPRLSRVHRLPCDGVGHIEDVRILRIDRDCGLVVGLPRDAVVRVDHIPVLACVVGAVECRCVRGHCHVEPPGLAGAHRDLDASESLRHRRQPVGQRLPRAAPVGALEEPARGAAEAAVLPRSILMGPERGVHDVRIVRREHDIGAAGVLILEQHILETLASVRRAEDPALGVGAVRMAERRHEEAIGIAGVDRDARDLLRVAETEVRPRPSGVRGLVHPVARRKVGAVQPLARSHIDDVRVRGRDLDCADRARRLFVEYRLPHAAIVGGLPDAAIHHAHVKHVRLAGNAGRGLRATAAERADVPPTECDMTGIESGLRRKGAGRRKRGRGGARENEGGAAADGHDEPLSGVIVDDRYFANSLFGIITWTPTGPSTSCVTSTSHAVLTSMYASSLFMPFIVTRNSMACRTASLVAATRSLSIPMAIQCVGVSPRGQVSLRSLRTTTWKRPTSEVSSAVMSTSPFPWPACPSPISSSAPLVCTGMKRVVPATSSLLSRLPAYMPGGALDTFPIDAGGATPIEPKNGCSGMEMLSEKCATIACLSSGMIFVFE